MLLLVFYNVRSERELMDTLPEGIELFQSRFKIFDDLLGDDIGIGEVVGGFEGFVLEPEDQQF